MAHAPIQNPLRLPRVLRLFDISVLSSASMGPAYSLASTMGPIVAAAGAGAPLAVLVLSTVMCAMAVAFARLSRIWPNAGSSYSWIRNAFGNGVGAYGAWLLLFSNFFATMSVAVPAGSYTLALLAPAHENDPLWTALVGAAWIAGSALLLYVGIRPTALVTAAALALELLVLAAASAAAWFAHPAPVAAAPAHGGIPLTLFGFVNAMTLAIWMSDGWEVSASTGEEVAGDARAAGRGGMAGLLVTTAILLVAMSSFLKVGTPAGFAAHQTDALAYVADLLGGGAWRPVVVITVLVSTCSTLWTTILYLSRSVYAMGRDGLLPSALGRLDRRAEPLWALGAIAVLVTLCQIATALSPSAADQLDLVLNVSAVFLGLLFVFSAAACVRRFWGEPGAHLTGVWIPAAGAVALLAILGATVAYEAPGLQLYAWGGVLLGIPFAAWRARHMARVGEQG